MTIHPPYRSSSWRSLLTVLSLLSSSLLFGQSLVEEQAAKVSCTFESLLETQDAFPSEGGACDEPPNFAITSGRIPSEDYRADVRPQPGTVAADSTCAALEKWRLVPTKNRSSKLHREQRRNSRRRSVAPTPKARRQGPIERASNASPEQLPSAVAGDDKALREWLYPTSAGATGTRATQDGRLRGSSKRIEQ